MTSTLSPKRLRFIEAQIGLTDNLTNEVLQLDDTLDTLEYNQAASLLDRDQTIDGLRLNQQNRGREIAADAAARKAAIDNRAAQSYLESMDAASRYINTIKQRGLEADRLIAQKEAEGQDIQEQIVIGEKLDTMQRDAEYITALVAGADSRASAVARGGGSNSSRRLALDSMQAFGRSYGLLNNRLIDDDDSTATTLPSAEKVPISWH